MLTRLFRSKKFQPTTLDDPTFGKLTNDRSGFWSSCTMFPPLAKEIDISINLAPGSDINQEHRDFFEQIVTHWSDIHQDLRSSLFEDLPTWEDGLDFDSFIFRQVEEKPWNWEIAASTPLLCDHYFGIMMDDLQNSGFRMDS